MDQEEAVRALTIIRQVIQETHEDLIEHNWGILWMIHAFTNMATLVAVGYFVEARSLGIFWYLVPFGINGAINLLLVLLFAERDRGLRSYIEWQIHGIWMTFILFTAAVTLVIYFAHASPLLFCPIFTMTSGIAFAMMGVVFYRHFLVVALVFLVAMVVAPLYPGVEWYVVGLITWAALFVPGVGMHLEKRRRRRAAETRIL